MSSKAFKNFAKFLMSGEKIKNYKIVYKIAITFDISDKRLKDIESLENDKGLIDRDTFYDKIKGYNFLNNNKIINGEYKEEHYEQEGGTAKIEDIPDDISFDNGNTIENILNKPLNVEVDYRIPNYVADNKYSYDFKESDYNSVVKIMKTTTPNNQEYTLQLDRYIKELCEYSDHSYKYTFGVLVYLENDKYVCPISYNASYIPHTILDNFKINSDSVGFVTLKGEI